MNLQIANARRRRHGFTLVELLIVVLVLAVLMAIATPLYISTISDTQKKTCRANMHTIADTVQAARVKAAATDYSAMIAGGVTTTNLLDLQTIPVCPNGGDYTLSIGSSGDASTFQVNCSAAGHGKFEPGVDSN